MQLLTSGHDNNFSCTHRSSTLFKKNLDDPLDFGVQVGRSTEHRVYNLVAFGGSIYYHQRRGPFSTHSIVNFQTDNAVFSSRHLTNVHASFNDIVFMFHSLQPGRW